MDDGKFVNGSGRSQRAGIIQQLHCLFAGIGDDSFDLEAVHSTDVTRSWWRYQQTSDWVVSDIRLGIPDRETDNDGKAYTEADARTRDAKRALKTIVEWGTR